MNYSSRAIALTYIRHGETSIVSRIFTEERGLQTFFIKGVRAKKSKRKIVYFEPLKLLKISALFNPKKSLHYLKDISLWENFETNPNKNNKTFIAFFIAEISSKVLQENEQNKALFKFVWETTRRLYKTQKADANFALKYLLLLSKFLGFFPSKNEQKKPFFNIELGEFSSKNESEKTCFNLEMSMHLKLLLNNKANKIPQEKKSTLLKGLLKYYNAQHYNLNGVTSHLIIESMRK